MSKSHKVGDEYRTNPLSHQPGGSVVRILFQSTGNTRDYDKVKHPMSFIKRCYEMDPDITLAWVLTEDGAEEVSRERWINYRSPGTK
jgi:hypothetical protein